MIKIYGMATCPDCTYIDEQVKGNGKYDVIDIGAHVKYMKEFLRLRDANPAFDAAKRSGALLRARRRNGDVEARRCRLAFALKRI